MCFAQAKTRLFKSGPMYLISFSNLVAGTGFEPVIGILYLSTCVGLGYGLMEGYFQEPLNGLPNPIREDNLRDPSHPPGHGILTVFPSTTPFGLALGAGLPCSD